ncbi:hypothetical protein ACFWOY_00615 [Streptomyces sp. NPDC058423]|uniref:hypothetical protein n=1 Tax=unclassified Streptomyces TaxID=2593676 RepID=UPI0036552B3A
MPYPVAEPGGKCLAPGVAGVAKILVAGDLRIALDLLPSTPPVGCGARDPRSSVPAPVALVRHLVHAATPSS